MADDTLTASVSVLLDEHARVQEELSDPAVHADAGRAKKLTKRYAELEKVAAAARHFAELESDHAAAVELAEDDADFAAEAERLSKELVSVESELRDLRSEERRVGKECGPG